MLSPMFIAAARSEIERLECQRSEIERQIALISGLLTLPEHQTMTPEITVNERAAVVEPATTPARLPRTKITIRGAIVDILTDAGMPLHYEEIYRRLTARGVKVGGWNPITSMIANMTGDRRLCKSGDGEWSLVRWNESAELPTATPTPALTTNVSPLPERAAPESPIRQRFAEVRDRVRREQEQSA